jgi:hypothetical protein
MASSKTTLALLELTIIGYSFEADQWGLRDRLLA